MKEVKGTVFVIISAVIFGCMPMAAKFIYAEGCSSASLTLYRYSLALPVLFLMAVLEQRAGIDKKGKSSGRRNCIGAEEGAGAQEGLLCLFKSVIHLSAFQRKQFLILSLGFCMTPLLLFASYNYISSGSATTIHFSYPVFVILAFTLIFREKASAMKKASVVFCILGLLLFYEPGQKEGAVGILLALASGVTYTFYMMFFDRSVLKFIKPFTTNFHLSLVSSILVFLYTIGTRSFTLLHSPKSWAMAFGFSFMLCVVACVLFQIGIALIGAQKASILSTFEPITSIVIGVICFQEKVGIKTGLGVLLILTAVLMITLFDNKKGRLGAA